MTFKDILHYTTASYKRISSRSEVSHAKALVNFLSRISRNNIEINLQGKKKWLPLSGFLIPPRSILKVAYECQIDELSTRLYGKLKTCVGRMDSIHAGLNDDGEAVLRHEARFHESARREVYFKIRELDQWLVEKTQHSVEDLDHLAQLANAYNRLQHAIAIIKEIAYKNRLHPDTIFLLEDRLRIDPKHFNAEEEVELDAIVKEFIHQEEFEITFDTGLARRFTVDAYGTVLDDDREHSRGVLPARVGDMYPDISKVGRKMIIDHFNTVSIQIGVLQDILMRDRGYNLPVAVSHMSGYWETNI